MGTDIGSGLKGAGQVNIRFIYKIYILPSPYMNKKYLSNIGQDIDEGESQSGRVSGGALAGSMVGGFFLAMLIVLITAHFAR